jgi:hypothetical protein
MPNYVVHVGPHKTGSSYLQWSFLKYRNELLARGICYPDDWGTINAHAWLVDRLQAGDVGQLAADFDRLSRSGYETVLLSSEGLSGLNPEQIGRLRDMLGGAEASIVFYCRRWSDILFSTWREMVKQGRVETFPEFLARVMLNPRAPAINFGVVLARFAEVFGVDRLRLVSFNEVLERQDDLFVHFCRSFLNWDAAPLPGFGLVNESLGIFDTELIRRLNAIQGVIVRGGNPYTRFMHHSALLATGAVTEAMRQSLRVIAIHDGAPLFAGIHHGLMQTFGANLVAPHRNRLFRPQSRRIEYVGEDYLMQAGIPEAIREIYRVLTPAAAQ